MLLASWNNHGKIELPGLLAFHGAETFDSACAVVLDMNSKSPCMRNLIPQNCYVVGVRHYLGLEKAMKDNPALMVALMAL